MANYLYAVPGSWPKGPYSLEQLKLFRDQEQISDNTMVNEENTERWVKLGVLLGTLVPEPSLGAAQKAPSGAAQKIDDLAIFFGGGKFSQFVLTIGQLTAIIVCLLIPISVIQQLSSLTEAENILKQTQQFGNPQRMNEMNPQGAKAIRQIQSSRSMVVVAGVLSFCLSAAMCIVFGRAKKLAEIAAVQDAKNQRIWRAIEEIRKGQKQQKEPEPTASENAKPPFCFRCGKQLESTETQGQVCRACQEQEGIVRGVP